MTGEKVRAAGRKIMSDADRRRSVTEVGDVQ